MTDQKPLPDQNDTPEDVATLYSWANLHGAKYRDFTASRAQAREEARQRAEEAMVAEQRRLSEEAERRAQEDAQIAARQAADAAEAARQAESERLAEIARQADSERQAVLSAQEAQRQAALQRVWQPPPVEAYTGNYAPSFAVNHGEGRPAANGGNASGGGPVGNGGGSVSFNPIGQSSHSAGGPFAPVGLRAAVSGPVASPVAVPVADMQPPAGSQATYVPQNPELSREPRAPVQGSGGRPGSGSQPDVLSSQQPMSNYTQARTEPFRASSRHQDDAIDLMDSPEQRDRRDTSARPAWLAQDLPPTSIPPLNVSPSGQGLQGQLPRAPQILSHNHFQSQLPGPGNETGNGPGSGHGNGPGAITAPDDTLQGSRDRIANRWYALNSVFDLQAAPVEQAPETPPARVPALAIFSLAGGVGKTSIVAALGRALSSRGERILLVDTASYGLLPFFFGARDQRPGMLRTFTPPGVSQEAPIQLVTLDPESHSPELQSPDADGSSNHDQNQPPAHERSHDWLVQEVIRYSRGTNRIVIDLPTASGSTTRRILKMTPVVLVPIVPDMNSVVSVGAIEGFFRNSATASGKPVMPYYVLNQFDYSLPLHLDVREILREQIGDRLLPFALRRNAAVSEALAEGMTVMDYAPTANVAEDYTSLAGWVRSLSAPAIVGNRGVRWSER